MAIKRGDFIVLMLAGAGAVTGAAWYGISRLLGAGGGTGADGSAVVVCQSKSGFYRVDSLSSDVEYEVDTPGTDSGRDADGGVNVVRIHGGAVEVARANCANQVCVEHAAVSRAGEQIVCLPHGVVVQVAAREQDVARLR